MFHEISFALSALSNCNRISTLSVPQYSFEAGNVHIKANVIDNRLIIDISDEGMGMSRDQLSKLFIKYEKTNNDRSVQGIGLYIEKKLIDHFEGEITINSIIEKGTQIQVSLPLLSI